jgi:hypothetical protein
MPGSKVVTGVILALGCAFFLFACVTLTPREDWSLDRVIIKVFILTTMGLVLRLV